MFNIEPQTPKNKAGFWEEDRKHKRNAPPTFSNAPKKFVLYLRVDPPCGSVENTNVRGRGGAFDDDVGSVSGYCSRRVMESTSQASSYAFSGG